MPGTMSTSLQRVLMSSPCKACFASHRLYFLLCPCVVFYVLVIAQAHDERPGRTAEAVRLREDGVIYLGRLIVDFVVSSPSGSCTYVYVMHALM